MIACKDELICCGCEACVQICPIGCISLVEKKGFLYPTIHEEKCLKCKRCESVCPAISRPVHLSSIGKDCETYVAYNNDAVARSKSSSGGLFIAFAEHVIDLGGYVCGAAWTNKYCVQHIIVDSKEQLYLLLGSKYIQSRTGTAYNQIKSILETGRLVLFTGTSCQIAGLLSFLQHDYSNLITIDVFCHGVPSPKLWKIYIDHFEKTKNISVTSVDFRNKVSGWRNYSVSYSTTEKCIQISHYRDMYMHVFLSNIALRDSCYKCMYKSFPRYSDVSIGDAWDGDTLISRFHDDLGLSVVVINSVKGKMMFNDIIGRLFVKKTKLNIIVPPLNDARKSVYKHPNRNRFLSDLDENGDFIQLYNDARFSRLQRYQHYIRRIPLYIYKFLFQKIFR